METHTTIVGIEILQGPVTPLEDIPIGRKDGMYYVIQNKKNVESARMDIDQRSGTTVEFG